MSAVIAPSIEQLEKAWASHIERESRRSAPIPRKHIYASQRRRCLRRSVLESTHPEFLPPFDAEVLARMRRGLDRERDIGIDLERAGRLCEPSFRVISQQERIEIKDRKGRVVITGKTDGKIEWSHTRQRWPFEIKAWSPNLTERVHSFADLYLNHWTWSGAHQLLSYLYANNEPDGLLILDRPGLPRFIHVRLEENLEQMESFLAEAESCVDHIEAETLPDFYIDTAECRRCPFYGSACQPPSYSEGAKLFVDEELIQTLERWHELRAAGLEWSELDEEIRKRLRGVELGIAGSFLIEGKWQRDTKYSIPDDVKARIDELRKPYAEKVVKGKFFLTITKA
jgi:hypothetical protein